VRQDFYHFPPSVRHRYKLKTTLADLLGKRQILHMDEMVIKDMVKDLNGVFGQDDTLLEANYGKIHEYLGMTIDYSEDNVVKLLCMITSRIYLLDHLMT
jgi:hypothetical protein